MQRLRKQLASELDRTTIVLGLGLLLMAAGCWWIWRPAGLVVPGAVLTWLTLPARVPFIAAPPEPRRKP